VAQGDSVFAFGIWQCQSDEVWREARAIWNSNKAIAGTQ